MYSHQVHKVYLLKSDTLFFVLSVKDGSPADKELHELSQKLAVDWKPVGRRLKIDEANITKFHTDNKELDEKAYQMLLHWKRRDGSAATYQVLNNALCNKLVNRKDLAEEFCHANASAS